VKFELTLDSAGGHFTQIRRLSQMQASLTVTSSRAISILIETRCKKLYMVFRFVTWHCIS